MPSRWIWILAVALAVTVLVLGAIVSESARIGEEAEPPEPIGRAYRIIGVWEDRVAVYVPQTDLPERVYEARVSALPADEQQKLREGIAVYDSEALAKALEDYVS